MPNNTSIELPDIIKFFDFLNSDTIEERKQIERYLLRKGMVLQPNLQTVESIKMWLATSWLASGTPVSAIKLFAKTMRDAWRIRAHRNNKQLVTLSISLDKDVSKQLTTMSRGHKKTEIITHLITGNYEKFLEIQQAAKKKKDADKSIAEMNRQNAAFDRMLRIGKKSAAQQPNQIEQTHQQEELLSGIAKLYELIFLANEQDKKIDSAILMDATKVYFEAFNR